MSKYKEKLQLIKNIYDIKINQKHLADGTIQLCTIPANHRILSINGDSVTVEQVLNKSPTFVEGK